MKNKVIFTLLGLLCLSFQTLFAQHTVKGKLVDEEGGILPSATVMLVTAKDSVLKSFGLSNSEGAFELKSIPDGKYRLQVTFIGMDNFKQEIELVPGVPTLEMGTLTLQEKSTELGEVEITAEMIPVQIKGDTIVYNADAFKTQPNANVEDLLKRLPGLEVDSDGNVKAQGETVTKVLVNGKEFFGNDPKVATKNLPANAIDKVQVFDKMSDMSEFTGVDDGTGSRTINLSLKEDRKNGFFGDVMGGYGTSNRFRGKANLNRFSDKSQISFLGMGNNINEQPFTMSDYTNFMGGASNVMRGMGGGGLNASDLGISWRGSGGQSPGINTAAAGGLNYNQDIGKRSKLSTSYFYNFLRADLNQTSYRENILEESTFVSEDSSAQRDKSHNHRVNLRFQSELDSTSRLIIAGSGKFNNANSAATSFAQSLTGIILQNSSLRDLSSMGTGLNGAGSVDYMKRFNKLGRSLAIQGSVDYQNSDKDLGLIGQNTYNYDTLGYLIDTLQQNQFARQEVLTYGGNATYTEPLGKGKFLEVLYQHYEQNNKLDKNFYNTILNASPEFDSTLSNRYDGNWRYDQAGANFRFVTKKTNFTLGVAGQRSTLKGTIGLADSTLDKTFLSILPSMRWNYTIKKGSRIRFRYSTALNAPSITQLSPVVDNSNPLNISVGNPDLKAEYAHSANFNYMNFDQFSFTTLFTSLRATYTTNKISRSVYVDSTTFKQVSSYTNVARDLNLTWFAHFSTPIRKVQLKLNVDPNVSYNKAITLINYIENPTNRLTSSINVSLENRKKDLIDVMVGGRLTHNITTYTLDANRNQSYLNHKYYMDVTVYLPKGFTLNSEFEYNLYTGGGFAQNTSYPLWKAYVGKTFLKGERGELRLSAFDILNRNLGFDRSTSINYLEQTNYNTLSRYVMLSFTYKFLTLEKGKSKDDTRN
ncbi:MAG: outer membrane beta-barrel protein [Bacteroidia bacterium]|nr:outer membrane beta-barrel protein [Bacteroidia bacterium]